MKGDLSDLMVGLAFLVLGLVYLRYAWLSRVWPTTPILNLDGAVRRIPISRSRFTLHARYHYEVEGHSYASRRVAFLEPAYNEERAHEVLAELKARGQVRYDPRDPQRAVLLPLPWGLGIALLLGGFALSAWEIAGPGELYTPPAERP